MLRVLQVTSELDGGGVERLLHDYCMRMSQDIHFDFVVYTKKEGILEKTLQDVGCVIFRVTPLRESIHKSKSELKNVIKKGHYDIVHTHQGYKGILSLYYAKRYGVKTRIAHSHIAYVPEGRAGKIVRKVVTPIAKLLASNLFACGRDAGIWMWGRKAVDQGMVYFMHNAIDVERFAFDKGKREAVRSAFGVQDKFVVGNVARFSYQKNHKFLVEVFAEIKKYRENAVLMLVGDGELHTEIVKQIENAGLMDSVVLLGVRNDIPDLLQAMDVFVLPSRYEGLPVTLVETQASELKACVSDSITKEIKITDYIEYFPLSRTAKEWADTMLSYTTASIRSGINPKMKNSMYDINNAVCELEDFYTTSCIGHGRS